MLDDFAAVLFPAHAGMNPPIPDPAEDRQPVPRTRGDEPRDNDMDDVAQFCSPHTRG